MKKILILLGAGLLLTGCVSVSVEGDTCYRFIDTEGTEHITTVYNSDNYCGMSYGTMYCTEFGKKINVVEYEKIKCSG